MDLNVDTSREIELLELIDGASGRVDDVEEALVGAHFELISRLFVHVNGLVHRELFDAGRKRNGTGNLSAGALGSFHDLDGGLVNRAMIESAETDANFLGHICLASG